MVPDLSRRGFLKSSGSLSASAWLKLQSPALVAISASACGARDASAPFRILTDTEAADLSAIAARLIPTTQTPGATEAGVVHFFDQAFAGEMQPVLERARRGLRAFNEALRETHPDARSLAALPASKQDEFLTTQEHTDFFGLTRVMTLFGFFAMDSYGGNRGHVGWEVIGFQGHHSAWNSPFGYYDAPHHEGAVDGE